MHIRDILLNIYVSNCSCYRFIWVLLPNVCSIIGLYVSFILLIGNVIRNALTGGFPMIMFTELPNVDRLLILCLDIYLVREALQLSLEEDLYAELMFLYRSPETLIKVTRRPKVKQDWPWPS